MKRKLFFSPHDLDSSRSRAEQRWSSRRGNRAAEESFRCINCGANVVTDPLVAGVLNRNHCPYCLWSRHLDLLEAGDRLCACKGPMRPVGLTLKLRHKKYAREDSGELMLIHACVDCDRISINRIAADDLADEIFAVFEQSMVNHESLVESFGDSQIRLLSNDDRWLVRARLFGEPDPRVGAEEADLL